MTAGPLGRLEPPDWAHVDKYPVRALASEARPTGVPVVMGVNWYDAFDVPRRHGRGGSWWVGRSTLGSIRGGHAVVLVPPALTEPYGWWTWYDQVSEGICVAEAVSRCQALLNRERYQPRPLYDVAQGIDEWPGASPDYEGTSVRAGLDVARTLGLVRTIRGERHHVRKGQVTREPDPASGISANRWALTVDEVLEALGTPDADYVEMANSWGRGYPRRVRVPAEVLARLLGEHGEFGIVTDR